MKELNKDIILANLPENRVNLEIYNEIHSTNELSREKDVKNDFNLIIAQKQTLGRGRQGKNWYSPNNGNIYMSISTEIPLNYAPESLITGIICADVLSNHLKKEHISLKWPNDIVLDNKKVGGILVEKEHLKDKTKTVIGVGINFRIDSKETWWGDLSKFNIDHLRDIIIAEITSGIINAYDNENKRWISQWQKYCIHMNKKVKIIHNDNFSEDGIFENIDEHGCAVLKTESGTKIFNSGEISIKGVY